MKNKWTLKIGYNDIQEIHDYWFISINDEEVRGTWTPNETMARRWLSMSHLNLSQKEIDDIVNKAKIERGSMSTEATT